MRKHWTPSTIGAILVIVGGFILKFCNIDGEVWSLVLIASGFLFGEQYNIIKVEKKVKKEINNKEVKDEQK